MKKKTVTVLDHTHLERLEERQGLQREGKEEKKYYDEIEPIIEPQDQDSARADDYEQDGLCAAALIASICPVCVCVFLFHRVHKCGFFLLHPITFSPGGGWKEGGEDCDTRDRSRPQHPSLQQQQQQQRTATVARTPLVW